MYNTHERIRRGYKNIVKCGGEKKEKRRQKTEVKSKKTKDRSKKRPKEKQMSA